MSQPWTMITVELPEDDAAALQMMLREKLGFQISAIKDRPALRRDDGAIARWLPMPPGGFIHTTTEDNP